jgi:GDP-L-fucose synthase
MKTLITGGSGLIGSEFKYGDKPSSGKYDLTNAIDVHRMMANYIPEVIIHTAAKVGGVGANMEYPAEFCRDNLLINTNIIDIAYRYRVKKLVCFLSTCIFPDEVTYPLTENKIHSGPPHTSNAPYAHAKRMADIMVQAYNTQYNTKYFSVIPTNVYGPNDNYNLNNSHVIPALIHKVYLAQRDNTDLVVWGSGEPLREFIFSKDVANLTTMLLEKYEDTTPVILSTSQEVSIKEVVETICDIFGFKNNITFDKSKPDGQYRKPSDNSHLKSIIGDYKFTPLRVGLEQTIFYFIENYDTIRK